MLNGSDGIQTNVYINVNNSGSNKSRQAGTTRVVNKLALIWIIVIGASLLISAGPAFGQFTVQPMQLEFAVTPGKEIKSSLNVKSFDPNDHYDINMSVVDLTQGEDGSWAVIEPNDVNDPNSPFYGFDLSKLSSCKDWISLDPTNFDLGPLNVVPVEITLRVQHRVRGFYGAAILATTNPMQGVGNISIVLRFVIPVILEIQDRPVRPIVQATDVGLEFHEATGESKSRSMVTMDIENDGGTYSSLKPAVRIWALMADGHWRVITTTDFQEKKIIPGAKLKLKADVRKSLPSGKYKMAGILFVDGRRAKKVEKEIDFVGDTSIKGVAADAPLDLEPIDLTMDGLPGATRMSTIKVYNASKETVNVRAALGLQSLLQNTAMGNVKGIDLDCTKWIEVTPEQFTLRGEGGVQTLRVINKIPETTAAYPCYYTLLALWASYPDGQQAGFTTTNICVRNKQAPNGGPSAAALKVIPQDLGDSKYLVAATFCNNGLVHFVPIRVKAGLAMANGIQRVSTFMTGDPSLMLPFETRDFSGVLDLSNIPADLYRLAAGIEYAPDVWVYKQMAVRVSIEGGRRVMQVLGVQEELNNLVEVRW
jgi:hypothetical protein